MKVRASVRHIVSASGALVVVASVARADAPWGSMGQYGHFDSADVVILDNNTGLSWQRQAYSQTTPNFSGAATYCASLSLGPLTSGWRVPSYKELLTLVDESPHYEPDPNGMYVLKYIDSHAFGLSIEGVTYTPVDASYWSSSLSPVDPSLGYVVDFKSGRTGFDRTGNGKYVRCVHD
jgi:hypothetical protein